jgi:hypothetical protein
VGITWTEGINNGGTPVIDYSLWQSIDNLTFTLVADSILTTSYRVTTVIMGTTYNY